MAEEGESTNTNSGFDFRARQAQFWKDVEMAEVLTDNDPEIANIIAQYHGNFNQKVSNFRVISCIHLAKQFLHVFMNCLLTALQRMGILILFSK